MYDTVAEVHGELGGCRRHTGTFADELTEYHNETLRKQ
jgi:hypothetical protein